VLTWFLFWMQPEPLLDGPSRWRFAVLFLVDFPISAIAFGAIFRSDAYFPYALVAWGLMGTGWWYFLGCLMDDRNGC
jgi:hypothetical protein